MWRAMICLLSAMALPVAGFASPIGIDELEPFSSPCDLSVTEEGSTRTLRWSAVSGASTYKIGRIPDGGSLVTLGEVTGTSWDDTTWDPNECYEYVMVAYDSSKEKICSAYDENVGECWTQ